MNLSAGYKLWNARITVQMLNALDEEDSDIQYSYYVEAPAEPREGRVGLGWAL